MMIEDGCALGYSITHRIHAVRRGTAYCIEYFAKVVILNPDMVYLATQTKLNSIKGSGRW